MLDLTVLNNTSLFCKLLQFFALKLTCPGKIALMDVIPVPEEYSPTHVILTWNFMTKMEPYLQACPRTIFKIEVLCSQ